MKVLLRICYSLLFMGFSLGLNASEESTVSIRNQKGQSFSLHLKKMKNASYSIQLSDKNGFVFIKEKVENQNDYLKLFNLKNLPIGNYQLSIENDFKIIIQDIEVLTQKLTIDPVAKREITKPNMQYQSTFLDLNMFHVEADHIKIMIRDKNNTELYQEKISKKGNINKRFNLKALPAGNYEVVVMTKHYISEQEFIKGVDHKLYLKIAKKRQRKSDKKRVSDKKVNKTLLPHEAAIQSRINWLNSKR